MKRTNCRWLPVALALAGLGSGHALAAEEAKPNIILCMTDDQGWGDTGYNGHPHLKTPELDAMAAAGIRFDRFYTANPLCSPTRASCLTGRSPVRYFCYSWGHDLPLREATLAEAAKKAGYATAHFGKWHLGGIPHVGGGAGRGPMNESVDPAPRHPGNQGFDEWFSAGNFYDLGYEYIYHNGKQVPPRKGDTADVLMDEALQWIGRQARGDKPFLALVWFPSPHSPFQAVAKYAEPYEKYGAEKANYYGELAAVDRNMGRLRRALREMGIAENTMLWFCSDNGGLSDVPYSTGGLPGGKKWLTEGGTRVPGILEWPGRVRKPFATTIPAGTLDFYPTTLEVLGIEILDEAGPIDGVSLLPLIEGRMDRRPKPMPLVKDRHQLRVIDNDLILQNGKLYRFDDEKKEDVDVSAEHPEVFARLTQWAEAWRRSVKEDNDAYKEWIKVRHAQK